MARKKDLSAGVGKADVRYLVDAFQSLNSCILCISFEATARRGIPDLMVIAQAFTINPVNAERVLLASWKSSLSQANCATLEGAIILSLYRLDGLLARLEMGTPG